VLTQRRQLLHGRAASAMESMYEDRLEEHLEELAHHYSRSADVGKAVDYLLKAGQSAVQRSASREALERFEAGLKLLVTLPASPARDQQELAARVAMLSPLREVRGPAAADIEVNLKRAEELSHKADTAYGLAAVVFQRRSRAQLTHIFLTKPLCRKPGKVNETIGRCLSTRGKWLVHSRTILPNPSTGLPLRKRL